MKTQTVMKRRQWHHQKKLVKKFVMQDNYIKFADPVKVVQGVLRESFVKTPQNW